MATLKLPAMLVDNSTGPMIMNLIAYAVCPDFHNNFEVSSYVSFLDSLIDMEEDVKELKEAGVLHNGLGSHRDVADLFNRMSYTKVCYTTGLVPDSVAYDDVKRRIQEHCNSTWATQGSQFYNTYFNSPCSFLAFAGAPLGLGLTAAETYASFALAK